jgi:hypothetical protein
MDSYVWDYAVGSAGFLISAMKLMIKDAENRLKSPELYSKKVNDIKCKQLLGIEKRADIYACYSKYDFNGRWLCKYFT